MKLSIVVAVAASFPALCLGKLGQDEKRGLGGKLALKPGETLDDKRYMAILKSAWPECVKYYMTAMMCKEQVDNDIMTINTGVHKAIRSVIVYKRDVTDDWYNSVAIQMDDSDLVKGRDNDGMVYYDFLWNGSGKEASVDAQRSIPLVELDPDNHETVPVVGATLDEALSGEDNRPIAGGTYDPTAQSTYEGLEGLDLALTMQADIAEPGIRALGPWDCSGLTGTDCCLLIKADVRDADMNDNAIQCYLDYKKGTTKYEEDLEPFKVSIYADHFGFVSQVPRVGS